MEASRGAQPTPGGVGTRPDARLSWSAMKRRARRAVIGAAALVVVVIVLLVVAHRDTVRDHLEAWHFQLTRETKIMDPQSSNQGEMITTPQILATYSNRRV